MPRDPLKQVNQLLQPDIRSTRRVYRNPQTGEERQGTLEDHHACIAQYPLHDGIPEDIATQYDVARNLYAYAWFEYRFFNVAEAQVLTTLELAMKERIGDEAIKSYIKQRKQDHKRKTGKGINLQKGMKVLMEYCRDRDLVRNDGFTQWRLHATQQAYYKRESELMEWAKGEMKRTGQTSIELPEIEIERLPPDPAYNHVQHLIDHTNHARNSYAHGSTTLYNCVLGSFEMVSEFINQLYPEKTDLDTSRPAAVLPTT